ncbi:hypothetical protein WJX73_000813 [Symbiochloris irregularis]|uniref:Uncharacterized protein n=1 Tax=Symbiochloris irregularis TaxID=706552 RepID=A0AAW1NUK7_9CHLO
MEQLRPSIKTTLGRQQIFVLPVACASVLSRPASSQSRRPGEESTRIRGGPFEPQKAVPIRAVKVSSTPSASGEQARSTPDKGYAILHDFCMSIPYGTVVAVTGVVAWATGSTTPGVALLSAGVLVCGFAALSLQCYQAGKKSTPFTVASAGVSVMAALFSWQNLQASVAKVPSTIALFLSAAISAFLVYNVAAGGNPPKGEKPLAEAAPHPVS